MKDLLVTLIKLKSKNIFSILLITENVKKYIRCYLNRNKLIMSGKDITIQIDNKSKSH